MTDLKAYRKSLNPPVTPDELAKVLGISKTSLWRIENGKQWPTRATILRIFSWSGGEVTANDFAGIIDKPRLAPAAQMIVGLQAGAAE